MYHNESINLRTIRLLLCIAIMMQWPRSKREFLYLHSLGTLWSSEPGKFETVCGLLGPYSLCNRIIYMYDVTHWKQKLENGQYNKINNTNSHGILYIYPKVFVHFMNDLHTYVLQGFGAVKIVTLSWWSDIIEKH